MAPAAEGGEEDQGAHGGQEEEGGEAAGLLWEDQNGSQPVSPGTWLKIVYVYCINLVCKFL